MIGKAFTFRIMRIGRETIICGLLLFLGSTICYAQIVKKSQKKKLVYKEIFIPTPNFDRNRKNKPTGVILHHTAEPTIKRSLGVLTSLKKKVGTHVVIDTDGTRYIMAAPEIAVYHAGYSILNGREGCNNFTIGIEFQGNTLEAPLTNDQIRSAIEYLIPLLSKYEIPLSNIVTHKMVRDAYKRKYPKKRCSGKVDITELEYRKFMKSIRQLVKRRKVESEK